MKTYQIILCLVFIALTVIGYFFDKKEDEPLKEKITYYRKPIMSILLLSSLLLCLSSGVVLLSWAYQNEENDEIVNGLLKNSEIVQNVKEKEMASNDPANNEEYEETKINFEYLKGINSDTVAWLEVEDTNINYPVVQTTDNKYYLKHSYENDKNSNGWIFADYRNLVDGNDLNLIIYGHNRINGTMFGTLKKGITKSWVDSKDTHIIKLVTKDYIIRYQIFSSYTIKEEGFYLRTSFKSLEYDKFLETLVSRSKYSYNTSVTKEDKIITLSTCSPNSSKRIVVHAKMISIVKHK
jgi:sortase B